MLTKKGNGNKVVQECPIDVSIMTSLKMVSNKLNKNVKQT